MIRWIWILSDIQLSSENFLGWFWNLPLLYQPSQPHQHISTINRLKPDPPWSPGPPAPKLSLRLLLTPPPFLLSLTFFLGGESESNSSVHLQAGKIGNISRVWWTLDFNATIFFNDFCDINPKITKNMLELDKNRFPEHSKDSANVLGILPSTSKISVFGGWRGSTLVGKWGTQTKVSKVSSQDRPEDKETLQAAQSWGPRKPKVSEHNAMTAAKTAALLVQSPSPRAWETVPKLRWAEACSRLYHRTRLGQITVDSSMQWHDLVEHHSCFI